MYTSWSPTRILFFGQNLQKLISILGREIPLGADKLSLCTRHSQWFAWHHFVFIQVEGVIHFENDIEELQQWDNQVSILILLSRCHYADFWSIAKNFLRPLARNILSAKKDALWSVNGGESF